MPHLLRPVRSASFVLLATLIAITIAVPLTSADEPADTAADRAPQPNRKPRPKLTLSREVTFLTEPLAADGLVDYAAALNAKYGKGVTPENNAAVAVLRAMGPDKYGNEEEFRKLCKRLSIDPLPATSRDYFLHLYEFVDEIRAEFEQNETATAKRLILSVDDLRRQLSRDQGPDADDALQQSAWTAKDEPLAAAWLARIEKPLELLSRASSMPAFYVPLDAKEPFAGMLSTSSISIRTLSFSDALLTRAMYRMAHGNHDAAWADVMAARRWAGKAFAANFMIDQLVGMALARNAVGAAAILATDGSFDEKRLQAMQKEWASATLPSSFGAVLDEGERCFGLEAMNLLYRVALDPRWIDILEGGGAPPPAETGNWKVPRIILAMFFDWDAAYATLNRQYDDLAKVAKMPPGKDRYAAGLQFEARMEHFEADRVNPYQWFTIAALDFNARRTALARYYTATRFAATTMPAVVSVMDVEIQYRVQERLVRTTFALSIYRASSGSYPAKLDDLVPALLDRVPVDDFGDEPLKYTRNEDGGFTLYSIGRNRKDDRGRSADPLVDTTRPRKDESAPANDENQEKPQDEADADDSDDLVIRVRGKK